NHPRFGLEFFEMLPRFQALIKQRNRRQINIMLTNSKTLLVAIATLLFVTFISAQSRPDNDQNKDQKCDPPSVNAHLMRGEIELALSSTQACIDESKSAVAQLKSKTPTSFADLIAITGVGHFLCNKAQIQLITGDLKSADTSIQEAEQFAQQWYQSYYDN